MPIIQKLLDKNPEDSFQLFNMGNEYMSDGDYEKALYYFQKSYANKNISLAYCPHLIFRMAACFHYLKRNEEGLTIIDEGLKIYPKCTDYEYFKGRIYKSLKRYSLAIDSFKKCISMGTSPANLSFLTDVEGFRAYVDLGNVYFLQDDFEKSLSFYLKAIKDKSNHYELIYTIGEVLNKMFSDKNKVLENLKSLFANGDFITNLLVMVDVLLNERLYKQGEECFKKIQNKEEYADDINYLSGRLLFYNKEYKAAFDEFIKVISSENKRGLLPRTKIKSFEYLVICTMACEQNGSLECKGEFIKPFIKNLDNEEEKQIILYFLDKPAVIFEKNSKATIYEILSEILQVSEFELFEKNLEVLNLIKTNEVLLDLAEIYYKNGFKKLAMKNIMRSVKELDVINGNAVNMLNKEFVLV